MNLDSLNSFFSKWLWVIALALLLLVFVVNAEAKGSRGSSRGGSRSYSAPKIIPDKPVPQYNAPKKAAPINKPSEKPLISSSPFKGGTSGSSASQNTPAPQVVEREVIRDRGFGWGSFFLWGWLFHSVTSNEPIIKQATFSATLTPSK